MEIKTAVSVQKIIGFNVTLFSAIQKVNYTYLLHGVASSDVPETF